MQQSNCILGQSFVPILIIFFRATMVLILFGLLKCHLFCFSVDPPAPIICPIGGRYTFAQIGDPWEKYYTRIRGITERPRHKIDCHEYISEFKSCDDNPKKLYVDAEYCNSVDHNAKPISEYGKKVIKSIIYQLQLSLLIVKVKQFEGAEYFKNLVAFGSTKFLHFLSFINSEQVYF